MLINNIRRCNCYISLFWCCSSCPSSSGKKQSMSEKQLVKRCQIVLCAKLCNYICSR